MPLPNQMDQGIASAINRAVFNQQAPAHNRIVNTRRNAKGTITAITHQNVTAEMAVAVQRYHHCSIEDCQQRSRGCQRKRDLVNAKVPFSATRLVH